MVTHYGDKALTFDIRIFLIASATGLCPITCAGLIIVPPPSKKNKNYAVIGVVIILSYNDYTKTEEALSRMAKYKKLFMRIMSGQSDANIPFVELCNLLLALGFKERVKGDHHIFYQEGIEEILNLQPKGTLAKAYQVKQVRAVILKYRMGGKNNV